MSLTLTIDLPDELASQMTALLSEDERDRFALGAIADALAARQQDADARLAASLVADLDPINEPEREAAECVAIVNEELDEVDTGQNLVAFEDLRRQWDEEKIARFGGGRP